MAGFPKATCLRSYTRFTHKIKKRFTKEGAALRGWRHIPFAYGFYFSLYKLEGQNIGVFFYGCFLTSYFDGWLAKAGEHAKCLSAPAYRHRLHLYPLRQSQSWRKTVLPRGC